MIRRRMPPPAAMPAMAPVLRTGEDVGAGEEEVEIGDVVGVEDTEVADAEVAEIAKVDERDDTSYLMISLSAPTWKEELEIPRN